METVITSLLCATGIYEWSLPVLIAPANSTYHRMPESVQETSFPRLVADRTL